MTQKLQEALRLAAQAFLQLSKAMELLAEATGREERLPVATTVKARRGRKPKAAAEVLPQKRGGRKNPWTPERIAQLKTLSIAEAAARFGLKPKTICAMRCKFGVAKKYKKRAAPPEAAQKLPKERCYGATREQQQDMHEAAKNAAAKYGDKATRGKVGVRVDSRTMMLMSPERAEKFKKSQNEQPYE
jgi:hypothetical protein